MKLVTHALIDECLYVPQFFFGSFAVSSCLWKAVTCSKENKGKNKKIVAK